jgi:hypothetical protein
MGTGSQSGDANIAKFDDRSRIVVLQAEVTRGQSKRSLAWCLLPVQQQPAPRPTSRSNAKKNFVMANVVSFGF